MLVGVVSVFGGCVGLDLMCVWYSVLGCVGGWFALFVLWWFGLFCAFLIAVVCAFLVGLLGFVVVLLTCGLC